MRRLLWGWLKQGSARSVWVWPYIFACIYTHLCYVYHIATYVHIFKKNVRPKELYQRRCQERAETHGWAFWLHSALEGNQYKSTFIRIAQNKAYILGFETLLQAERNSEIIIKLEFGVLPTNVMHFLKNLLRIHNHVPTWNFDIGGGQHPLAKTKDRPKVASRNISYSYWNIKTIFILICYFVLCTRITPKNVFLNLRKLRMAINERIRL